MTKRGAKFDSFGEACKVSMMCKRYTEQFYGVATINSVEFSSVRLPYKGGKFAMLFLLPKEKNEKLYCAFEKKVFGDAELIEKTLKSQKKQKLAELKIPRFTVESRFEMKDTFKALGVKDLFNSDVCNLKKIVTDVDIYVSDVIHQAKMIVDEEGTVAAAATVVVSRSLSMRKDEVKFVLNRPFYCILYHVKTNTNLFCAKIVKPTFKK